MNREPESTHTENAHTELAALADGTLPAERHEQLLAQVADSPELTVALQHQRHAVAIMRSLEEVQAPSLLRRSIETLSKDEGEGRLARAAAPPVRNPRPARRLFPRVAAGVALAIVAVVAVAVALTAGGSSSAAPTVLQASSVAQRPATLPAPAENPHNHRLLTASAAGIAYPYWGGASLGWSATGARTDTVGGRTVTTVFYTDRHARRIGYSIVSGGPLAIPAGSTAVVHRGVSFHVLQTAAATLVTWRETGHTCILLARGVSATTLVHLVTWDRA
jgi:hypothetical protein